MNVIHNIFKFSVKKFTYSLKEQAGLPY